MGESMGRGSLHSQCVILGDILLGTLDAVRQELIVSGELGDYGDATVETGRRQVVEYLITLHFRHRVEKSGLYKVKQEEDVDCHTLNKRRNDSQRKSSAEPVKKRRRSNTAVTECDDDNSDKSDDKHQASDSDNATSQVIEGDIFTDPDPDVQTTGAHSNTSHDQQVTEEIDKGQWKDDLTCPYCDTTCKSALMVKKHIQRMHRVRTQQCTECDSSFVFECDRKWHMKKCHGAAAYMCDSCGKHYKSRADLDFHKLRVHNEEIENAFYCTQPHCGKVFHRKDMFSDHMNTHLHLTPYICQCGKSFSSRMSLRNHVTRCQTKHVYRCHICEAVFPALKDLQQHQQKHQDVAYKCSRCGKTFKWKNSFYRHLKTCSV